MQICYDENFLVMKTLTLFDYKEEMNLSTTKNVAVYCFVVWEVTANSLGNGTGLAARSTETGSILMKPCAQVADER
jgi:hypothetical protein